MRIICRVFFVVITLTCGCESTRVSYIPQMQDKDRIVLNNRYKLAGYYIGDDSIDDLPDSSGLAAEMHSLLPNVFADDGKLFIIRKKADFRPGHLYPKDEPFYTFFPKYLLMMCSFTTVPVSFRKEQSISYVVQLVDSNGNGEQFDISKVVDGSFTLFSPFALIRYNGPPDTGGKPCFFRITNTINPQGSADMPTTAEHKAIAYAVALKLMEMEKVGLSGGTATLDRYKIIKCERELEDEFAYAFTLELIDPESDVLRTFKDAQDDFRSFVKREYSKEHKGVNQYHLVVDFPHYDIKDGLIEGRAVVMSIRPKSFTYDPNTRKGKIAVLFNPGQYEYVRRYIKRHIESVARQSNIECDEGVELPEGLYYSLGEKIVDGDSLEVEFKTE